ncbi:MAG TPA: carboxypeptidase-like regulatory domain-containing protein [Candidatus Dormibacteraeota bacterium]|nr:carboxypeptidase-like regulatory domain-containing protein [Candidatus Dormibacteraeota bacterium]
MIFRHCQRFLFVAVFGAISIFFGAEATFSQTDRSTLEGTVTDSSGGAISGARVKILAVATGIADERRTNSNGYYRFPGLPVGQYQITVANPSFKTKVVDEVTLEVGQTRTLDVTLDVGAIDEKVEIKAEADPAERTSAAAATVINTEQIANLPVNGRDWSALTLLAAFAQDDGGGNQRTIRYAGRAIDDNNFNFDGVDAGGIQEQAQKSQVRLQISEDAIAEYRVNSALYDAEYGTQAGGQINVVTKSGSNDFHGTAFGYLRNSAFDARNFTDFDINGNAAIPPFRLGQYGLTVGGPIIKDKTFFFLSYEGLRQLQSTTQVGTVPSALLVKDILVNGRAGVGGPSPQMCPILQAYPWRASTGTVGGCAPRLVFPDAAFTPGSDPDSDQFTHPTPAIIHEDTALVRIDHRFTDKTTLYGRAQRDILHSDQPISPLFDVQNIVNHPANYFLALQHIFTANLFNEAKVYVNRSPYHNPQASVLPYAVSTNSNFTSINNNSADIEIGTTFGFIDNLTWTRGRHTFKTGMEIRRVRLNQGQTANNNLSFGDNSSLITATLTNVSFIAPWCCHKYRRTFYMPYFQDEWKITPTFTASLGIRWDYFGVANVPDNRTTVFDLNQFHGACLGSGSFNTPFPVPINTPPCPKNPSLYNPNYKNFDPRVSFAWAPASLHGKTVIRAGFGIYHGAAQNDDLNAGLESDTFRASVNSPTLTPALEQETPDLTGFASVANHPRALQREDRRDLYSETWGLTIEQQLPAGFLFSTSYLGSHGVHLFSRGAVNLCSPGFAIFTDASGTPNCTRPLDQFFPGNPTTDPYGSVDFKHDVGLSSYHGLLLSLERKLTSGLSFQAHYTFSHSINDGAVGGGEANGPENVNCRQCDKGPSVFDIRHNVTANAIYELPFGPGKTYLHDAGVLGKIVEGWEFSTLGTWHTGHPLTVSMGLGGSQTIQGVSNVPQTFLLPDGNDQTNQRPDIVPGVPLYLPGGGTNGLPLINPAAFQAPPVDANGNFTRFGNAGNGVARALNIWQVDMALMKETKLTERFALQFGVQFFNIFNHVQLGDPGNLTLDYLPGGDGMAGPNLSAPSSFGLITNSVNGLGTNTGTGLPRQLQFMLRLKF